MHFRTSGHDPAAAAVTSDGCRARRARTACQQLGRREYNPIRRTMISALVGGAALLLAGTASAQQADQQDPSSAAAGAATAVSAPADDQQAKIERLEAQVQALQESIEALKAQMTNATPSWKGAPQVADKESGFSFKPRGRLMYDAATLDGPEGYDNAGLGFANEVRRARLGVEGTIPGDFGYKFEVDFAAGDVEFADAYLSHQRGPVELILGQHNNFQSLEELTSSLHTSFIERAAFTDAFGFERRVGISGQYLKGPILVQGGVFTDSIADLNAAGDDNNSYGFDGRLVYMPTLGSNQLHFAGSYHWRDINDAAMSVRYRQRPAVHTTDVRFIDSGSIGGAEKETGYGLEAAGIVGPFHVASEAFWQKVSRAGFENPTFFGAYVEGGYFLTGDRRGYKAGRFDRVKVKNPFGSEGGWGALSINVRWDHLDLIDAGIVGGRQNAYQASLNWKPVDYVLFGLNYAHIRYTDAAIATDAGDRDYSVDMLGLRSQIDF